jgi:transcriptional regulator GlxA family with amidase domain
MFLKRPGGQSQFSRHLAAQQRDDVFGTLELWMLEHLDADLSVETLARRASMSPRHFARLFKQRLGTTPAAYVRRIRVEEARRQIETAARASSMSRVRAALPTTSTCAAPTSGCWGSRRRNIAHASTSA